MAKRKRKSAQQKKGGSKRKKKHAEDDTAAEQVVPKRASLPGLPAELRNKMYFHIMEDVLDEQFEIYGWDLEYVKVSPSFYHQPAICRVNRQLRQDTLKIFYNYAFDIDIQDLQFGPHAGHFVWTLNPYMVLRGSDSWKNFKQWLHLYFNDRSIPTIKCERGEGGYAWTDQRAKCAPAFEMVARLADAGVEWDVVADALEAFKDATGGPTVPEGKYMDWWEFSDA